MVTCAKTAKPIEMQFGLLAPSGSRNHELDGGPDPPTRRGNFGERVTHCKVQGLSAVNCVETAELIDLPYGLWTRG